VSASSPLAYFKRGKMEPILELILPLRCKIEGRDSDLARVLNGLLPSLVLNDYHKVTRRFAIICPENEKETIMTELANFSEFVYRYYTDEEVLRSIGFGEHEFALIPGWFKQQLFKLFASEQAEAGVVLILDSDVIASRPVPFEQLSNGVLPYQQLGIRQFYNWFRTSALALQVDISRLPANALNNAMGVTPEFLSRPILHEMLERLRLLSENDWAKYLMKYQKNYEHTWTEYTLYWIWYSFCARELPIHVPTSLYRFIEDKADVSATLEAYDMAPFVVLQSTKLSLKDCRDIYTDIANRLSKRR
jgi:hypothetical protein